MASKKVWKVRIKKKPRETVDLNERYTWSKVEAPKTWYPKNAGEELAGYYGGRTLRDGMYGQYELVLVHVPNKGSFFVSGVRVIQLIDAARIEPEWPVRIVFRGLKELPAKKGDTKPRMMKQFEVLVADAIEEDVDDVDCPPSGMDSYGVVPDD